MKLSAEEKAANRAAFKAMTVGQKAEYVFAYYKLPLVLALVAAVALGSIAHRLLTHKEPLLYAAYVNVVPNDGVDEVLTGSFVEHQGLNPRKAEVYAYRDLYLTSDASTADHGYAYASKIKLMAAVDAEQLDVVLMNQEAYDLLSASGYLLDLPEACTGALSLPAKAEALLATNTVVLSDNRIEVELDEADEYVAQTIEATNALEVTELPLFEDFSDDESLYLGIIANTPRLDTVCAYLRYVVEPR